MTSLVTPLRSRGVLRRTTLLGTAVVATGLVLFVAAVYVLVVLGGGVLIGRTSSPDTRLSIVATVIVAVGLDPARIRLRSLARRWVDAERRLPYDALSHLSGAVAQSQDHRVLVTMARVLAEGTGAAWAQVWLLVGHTPVLAATWPEDATEDRDLPSLSHGDTGGRRTLPVVLAGETLGALRIQERPHQPLTPVEERLFDGLAAQAGLVLRGERLRAELARRLDELSARAAELRTSRGRVVEAQDAERRRLERDIHDGAQQHLVALAVNLRLVQTLATSAPDVATRVVSEQVDALDLAIETIVDLSRGIYPGALSEHGLGPAIVGATASATTEVSVTDRTTGRPAPEVALAVYFCCLEAVQNALKHAAASRIAVSLDDDDRELVATIHDDGRGFDADATPDGAGLANMRDRLDVIGGRLTVESLPHDGTLVTARVPTGRQDVR